MSDTIKNKIGMVIVAHPDDAEFGCAGSVANWVLEGWEFYYVICSDGSGGGSDDARQVGEVERRKISEIRKKEQREACRLIGVKEVFFLDYPDGRIEPSLDLRRDIVRMLRHFRPSRVVIQSPERAWTPFYSVARHHPDHLATGEAAIRAIYPASQNPWDFPELLDEGLEPHKVQEIFFMGAPTQNFMVDITGTIELKLAALKAHASQLPDFAPIEERIRSWATSTGKKYDVSYAEEFHRTEN
ncbi:PIG-L deacetylase family protein [Candidatus Chlorohelix sp.]|uniref:PIG-L deacetylase family protein n=1 Tax=Candidatus Chlorohelix sp. TaxID=3139201 RepID=UPI0030409E7D